MRKQTQPYKVKILEVATIITLLVLIIVIDIAIIIWVGYSQITFLFDKKQII